MKLAKAGDKLLQEYEKAKNHIILALLLSRFG
jgi:hypothetical protein